MKSTWNPATTPNFSVAEMACRCGTCGGRNEMQQSFMEKLQAIRDEYGSMTIVSAFRCPNHPEEARKSTPGSHAQGRAADIRITSGAEIFRLEGIARKHGIVGLGRARSFVHLDDGHDTMPRPAAWTY